MKSNSAIIAVFLSALLVCSAMYAGSNSVRISANAQQMSNSQNALPHDLISSIINSGNAPSSSNFKVASGFKMEPLLWNVSFPSSVTFDGKGHMFIAESGMAFGGVREIPRILSVDLQTGAISIVADRFLSAPITSIIYHNGSIYASNSGKISKVDPRTGVVDDLISDLPVGDHPADQIAFGPDGRMYVAMGSATNSGVVGVDNYLPSLGWLASFPMTHDVPAKNVTLTGKNFQTPNVLADGKKVINATKDMNQIKVSIVQQNSSSSNHKSAAGGMGTAAVMSNNTGNVTTGAFMAFGNQTHAGQVVMGSTKCTACIISAKPDGTDLKVVAWGLRLDIFSGIAFDKAGKLIVADSGSEERGSRPIKGDHDKVWKIDVSNGTEGKWYGWPDFALGNDSNTTKELKPVTDPQFHSPRSSKPLERLIQNLTPASKVFADPGYAVKMTQAVLAPDKGNLGLSGMILLGEYGTHAPTTQDFGKGSNIAQYMDGNITGTKVIGQKVVMLNSTTGNLTDFVSLKKPDPSFRPVDVSFSPDGNDMFIVSLGKVEHRSTLPTNGASLSVPQIWPYTDTGIIWRVSKTGSGQASEMPSKFHLAPQLTVAVNSGPAPKPDTIQLQQGYKAEPLLWNLDLPATTTFDDKGNMYVGEVGFAYNGLIPPPRILKVEHQSGEVSVFVDRGLDKPLTYLAFHDGQLYASNGGRISTIDMQGRISNIMEALPGIGDHYVDQIAFGPDGRMYFGIGTATNSGVVGRDNGWVKATPTFHDIPGENITLTGVNFHTENFFTAEKNDSSITGAYVPFGTETFKGQVIKGDTKCTGCIISANTDGSDLKLVAWGLRHPYGVSFSQEGKLIITMNGVDERGSRNVANDGDKLYIIDVSNSSSLGKFYGWPDYYGNGEPVTEEKFSSPRNGNPLSPLILNPPPVVKPTHVFETGAALTHVAFSNNSKFGYVGKAFIGEFGTLAPQTHLSAVPDTSSPGSIMGQTIGQKVITFDPKSSEIGIFMSLKTADLSFRPSDVKFSPTGDALYVTSVGKYEVRTITNTTGVIPFPYGQPWAYPWTGILWKVTPSGDGSGSAGVNRTAVESGGSHEKIIQGLTIGSSSKNNYTTPETNATSSEKVPESANVTIALGAALKRDQAFQPDPVIIKANGTVTWTNKDNVVHTVTSGDGFNSQDMGKVFDSGMLGGWYSHLFNATGTYNYFCQIHPTMKGKVIVR
jgi:glucose/arabinose dehydrogenase/plastocyanin